MSKKIKIHLKDKNDWSFYLDENASKNDFISIKDEIDSNTAELERFFKLKEEQYKFELRNQIIEEYKKSEDYVNLKNEVVKIGLIKENEKNILKSELFNQIVKWKNKYDALVLNNETQNKLAVHNQLKSLIEEHELKLLSKFKKEKEDLLLDKEKNYQIILSDKEKELVKKEENEKNLQNQIEILKQKMDNFNALNSKVIGENFEQEIYNEIDKNFILFDDIKWEKDSDLTETGTKADFIFTTFLDEKRQIEGYKATIECKSEKIVRNSSSRKNKYFIPTLLKNTKKNKSNFGFLVTTLEKEHEFDFREITDFDHNTYKNIRIFILRPSYLTIFLNILYLLNKEYKKIYEMNLDESQKAKIRNDFIDYIDSFKDQVLVTTIKQIGSELERVKNLNEAILTNAKKIDETIEKIIEDKFRILKSKFEKFTSQIQKKFKKLDHENLASPLEEDLK